LFSYDFDLKLPHGGLWSFQMFVEGSGVLYVDVTLIEPSDPVGNLADPVSAACSFLAAAALISMVVVSWRSGTADTVLKK